MSGRVILTSGLSGTDNKPWRCSHGLRAHTPNVFWDGSCSVEYAPRVTNAVLAQIRTQGGIANADEAWGYADSLDEHVGTPEELEQAWRVLAHWIGVYGTGSWQSESGSGHGGVAVGVYAGGEGGTGAEGDSSRVVGGDAPGAVDQSVLAVDDGEAGERDSSGGPSRPERPTPGERLERIREILNRPEEPDGYHLNGFPDQYAALADLYDEDFASELREAVEG